MNFLFPGVSNQIFEDEAMLNYAIAFLVVALIAAALGFSGVAGTAAWIAQLIFVVFLVLFLISLFRGRRM